MPAAAWDDLLTRLAVPRAAQREAELHNHRGRARRYAPGTGPRPRLTLADRLLATVLHQRFAMPQQVIGELFGVHRRTINTAVRGTRQLLDQVRRTIEPAGVRLDTLGDLADYAADAGLDLSDEIKPASYLCASPVTTTSTATFVIG
jgi:hypothetical protein